eukprot:09922.XXX_5831_6680_1 [CDS] Oithona nana genome sequencing.
MTEEPDTFYDSRFAAEINNRMRVPDRIMVAGENQTRSPTFVGINGPPSSFGRERVEQKVEMLVPDRILVAGGDRHIAAKSTPFEMQVENSVMPPSRHDVRVTTPPRSIRLDDHNFPSVTNQSEDEQSLNGNEEYHDELPNQKSTLQSTIGMPRSASVESESLAYGSRHASDPSMAMLETIQGGGGHNPWEEIQLVRRQIAKLNHRLMAVELENQQQQQREMILTVLVSAYFVGKFFMWLNKSP